MKETVGKIAWFKQKISLILIVQLALGGLFIAPQKSDAVISDGANAVDALGQYGTNLAAPSPVYTKSGTNNGPSVLGFVDPTHGVLDAANDRFFVADSQNNRVVVYNLNANDTFPDRIMDAVLGQPDLLSSNAATTQTGMSRPTGLALDSANNRLFVADASNHRVLVYDVATVTNGENAVNVLGQANFTSGTSAVTQSRLNNPFNVAYDSANSRLFVADSFNNRVMVFDVASITDGENAINVLGQTIFTSNSESTTQSTMTSPIPLAYDGSSRLFVGDANRVVVFDVTAITDGENAVNVLGQSNFTATAAATTQSGLNGVFGVTYASTGSRLFVSDTSNNRVMVFDVTAITDGENAVNVLGQSNFTSAGAGTSQSTFNQPVNAAFDVTNNRLFVADGLNTNNRVMVFDVASITDGENAVDLLGQFDTNLTAPAPNYVKSQDNNGPNQLGLNNPTDGVFDTVNHRFFLSDGGNNRVLVYNLNTNDTFPDRIPDFVLGQPDFLTSTTAFPPTQASIRFAQGVAYDPVGNRLFVGATGDNRVLVFDVASITNGENAVNVLGQADFTSRTCAIATAAGMCEPWDLTYDSANSRLFVADYDNGRVTVFNVASITNGESPVNVLGQPNFTTVVNQYTQAAMSFPQGVAYDATGNRLFVADGDASRVTVYDVASITDGENAVNVLGESTFTSTSYTNCQGCLNYPTGLDYESSNKRLYVSDAGTNAHRVSVFDVNAITNGENAVNVLGKPDYTTTGSSFPPTQASLSNPESVMVDATNQRLLVGDRGNKRIMFFDISLSGGSNSPTLSNRITLSRIKVSTSATVDVTFTLQNTLSGTLTVTFPAQFTVTAAANGGASSGCLSGFGFTSTTLTATKTNCSGTITLGGATVTNPASPGTYHISWVNDDPGGGDVVIVSEDQVSVTSSIDPSLSFNVGAESSGTGCAGTFAGNGGTVALGTLTTGAVASSDVSSVNHICTRLSTNGSAGAVVAVRSANAALKSTATPADTIPSTTATVTAGTANYGLCAGSAGADSGRDSTTPVGAAPSATSPFNGACSTASHAVGGLTTSSQGVWAVTAASQNAFFRLYVKAAIAVSTPAHNDYTDTLTFVATGTY